MEELIELITAHPELAAPLLALLRRLRGQQSQQEKQSAQDG